MPLVEGQFFLGTASTSLSLILKTGRSGPGPELPFCENLLNSGPEQFVTHPFESCGFDGGESQLVVMLTVASIATTVGADENRRRLFIFKSCPFTGYLWESWHRFR